MGMGHAMPPAAGSPLTPELMLQLQQQGWKLTPAAHGGERDGGDVGHGRDLRRGREPSEGLEWIRRRMFDGEAGSDPESLAPSRRSTPDPKRRNLVEAMLEHYAEQPRQQDDEAFVGPVLRGQGEEKETEEEIAPAPEPATRRRCGIKKPDAARAQQGRADRGAGAEDSECKVALSASTLEMVQLCLDGQQRRRVLRQLLGNHVGEPEMRDARSFIAAAVKTMRLYQDVGKNVSAFIKEEHTRLNQADQKVRFAYAHRVVQLCAILNLEG